MLLRLKRLTRAKKGKIAIICKTTIDEANTAKAQGGIASVTNLLVDNFEKHIEDTMIAGDYISDRDAVEQVVRNAPEQIRELVNWGVNFDKNENGDFDLHREGGHSEFRILHHADDTGFEIQRGLIEAVRNNSDIQVFENHFAVEIITQHHLGVRVTRRTPDIECYGAYVLNPKTGKIDTYLSTPLENIDSKILLRTTVALVREKGYAIGNIDTTICAERPKLNPHIPEMQRVMAQVMGIDPDDVSIKATTTERLGFTGREEGISAYAVALLTKG